MITLMNLSRLIVRIGDRAFRDKNNTAHLFGIEINFTACLVMRGAGAFRSRTIYLMLWLC